MRLFFVAVLLPGLVLAAPRRPVLAWLPPAGAPALKPLGLLVTLRASELVETTGRYTELHVKQALAVAEAEQLDLTKTADPRALSRAKAALGADRLVLVAVELNAKNQLVLSGQVTDGKKPTPFAVPPCEGWAEVLQKGADAAARAIVSADGLTLSKKVTVQPDSMSDAALEDLGACTLAVYRQPMGVETPSLLDASELESAVAACARAARADPSLRFATATLALGDAILGDDAGAARALASLGDADDVLEAYSLARFWMLTRFQSNEAGVALLKDVIARHPGELLLRAYLGETLDLLGRHPEALKAWQDYLALAPLSAFAQARLGKSLARLGKYDEAIAATQKALELDPAGVDARLQLGSRYIDAARPRDAIAALQILATPTARGEVLLRLGWAQWMTGAIDGAAQLFQQALDRAAAPGEWRTRGRAFYNLALVEAKRGRADAARVSLKASLSTGFRVRDVDPLLAQAARELERGAFDGPSSPADAGGQVAVARPTIVPKETSLFPVDAFGEANTRGKKPPPPEGLVLYRF